MTQLLIKLGAFKAQVSAFLSRRSSLAAMWVLACAAFFCLCMTRNGEPDWVVSSAFGVLLVVLTVLFFKLKSRPILLTFMPLVRFIWLVVLSVLSGVIIYLTFIISSDPEFLRAHIAVHLPMVMAAVLVLTIAVAWYARGPGWLFREGSGRFYRWATLFVASMFVLYYSVEKWHGKRLWAAVQREMAARGEKPGLDSLDLPPVPEDQDVGKTAIFAPLSNYDYVATNNQIIWRDKPGYDRLMAIRLPIQKPSKRDFGDWTLQHPLDLNLESPMTRPNKKATNVLTASPEAALMEYVAKFSADLEEIRLASLRPYVRFKEVREQPYINQKDIFPAIGQVFDFRAVAELRSGQSALALEDSLCSLRLSRLGAQQGNIYRSDRTTLRAVQPIWEGLAGRQWTDAQIALLEAELAKLNLLSNFVRGIKREVWFFRYCINQTIPIDAPIFSPTSGPDSQLGIYAIRIVYPVGWSYQDQADLYWRYRQIAETVDVSGRCVFIDRIKKPYHSISSDPVFTSMGAFAFGWSVEASFKSVVAQSGVNLARVACALERYRLAQGHYPETLDALASQFAGKMPADVINGEPLRYRLDAPDHFTLYSVGWNETDDKGAIVKAKADEGQSEWRPGREWSIDAYQGDWVWAYPKKK